MANNGFPKAELGALCSKIGSGATPRGGDKVYLDKGEVALIRSQNIHNDGFNREGLVYIAEEHAEKLSNVTVESGDVLLNITGDSVARCCQVDTGVLPARVNQHVAIIRPNPEELHPRFLRYFLVSPTMQSEMLAWSHAGATRKALTKGMIESFKVPKPDPMIQGRIAQVLGTLDDKIELNRRMNRTLEKMATAIFKSWFIDFDPVRAKAEGQDTGLPQDIADLFPDSFEDSELGEIPKGWTVTPMKDLADVNARSIKKDYSHARIRYVDISSVSQGSLDQTTTYDLADAPSRAKRLVQTGDTIWSCVRPNRKAYLYIDQPTGNLVVSTGFAVLSPRAVPASYLHQWVTTQSFVDYLTAYATGAAYPAVKADTFETAKMLQPAVGVLKAFHNLVGPLRARIAHNQRQNRRLAGLRDTLLPKLLSGELEAPANEAVEEGAA